MASFEAVEKPKRRLAHGEVLRKILHMLPGIFPFLMKDMPHLDPLDNASLIFLVVVSVVLTTVFLGVSRLVRRPGEDNLVSTVISYPFTVVGAMVLFPSHLEFACVVVIILAFGDGSAFLFGKCLGKTRLPWNPSKTWVGTMAFALISGPLAALAFWLEAKPQVPVTTALACGLLPALAGAIAESVDVRMNDNLRVGAAALLTVVLASFAMS